MFPMSVLLIHAISTKWLSIHFAIQCQNSIMKQASLRAFVLPEFLSPFNGNFDLLQKSLFQRSNSLHFCTLHKLIFWRLIPILTLPSHKVINEQYIKIKICYLLMWGNQNLKRKIIIYLRLILIMKIFYISFDQILHFYF